MLLYILSIVSLLSTLNVECGTLRGRFTVEDTAITRWVSLYAFRKDSHRFGTDSVSFHSDTSYGTAKPTGPPRLTFDVKISSLRIP